VGGVLFSTTSAPGQKPRDRRRQRRWRPPQTAAKAGHTLYIASINRRQEMTFGRYGGQPRRGVLLPPRVRGIYGHFRAGPSRAGGMGPGITHALHGRRRAFGARVRMGGGAYDAVQLGAPLTSSATTEDTGLGRQVNPGSPRRPATSNAGHATADRADGSKPRTSILGTARPAVRITFRSWL